MLQNLAWAAGYNVVALPLAAGALAWAGITLAPAIGAVLMSGSTIVVALNAQLLRRLDLRPEPAPPSPKASGGGTTRPSMSFHHQNDGGEGREVPAAAEDRA